MKKHLEIRPFFIEKGLLHSSYEPSVAPLKEKLVDEGHVYEMEGVHEPWIQDPASDYITITARCAF